VGGGIGPGEGGNVRVLFVSSEIYPLAKTGGLADVSAALPRALTALGIDVHLVMPGYPGALRSAVDKTVQAQLRGFGGEGTTRVISARMPDSGLPVWLVDCPSLFERDGGLYQDERGHDWPDNARRFAHLSRVAAGIAEGGIVPGWRADIVHGNDWHTGLLPLLLKTGKGLQPASLFTIHNLAFQGLFQPQPLSAFGLPEEMFNPDGVEFHGRISFLKSGIRFSDGLTTVSPSYAREILTPEFGCGLDGLLRSRAADLEGIVNGVDFEVWDPSTDAHLPATFDRSAMAGKAHCKAELQRELGLEVSPDTPLVLWASRITHQKMADTALRILPSLLQRDVQFALIGEGDEDTEDHFIDLAASHPTRMAVRIGYDEPSAHRFYGASDLLLHPSRFEPCGLTPLYGMRYGAVPIVRRVGGLSDTIVDADTDAIEAGSATGFAFREETPDAMLDCVDRALAAHTQPAVGSQIRRQGMARDSSWAISARRYLAVYRRLAPVAPVVDAEMDGPMATAQGADTIADAQLSALAA
jgi:starch synthase